MFSFPGKISYIRKIFWDIRKIFSYLGKNVIYPENFFEMTSPPPPPVANISGILDALFYSKSAPQSLPPQLLEASYAPAYLG